MAPLNAMTNLQEQSHAQTLLPASALLDWLCAWLLEEGPTRTSVREKAPFRATTSLQGNSHSQTVPLVSAPSD